MIDEPEYKYLSLRTDVVQRPRTILMPSLRSVGLLHAETLSFA